MPQGEAPLLPSQTAIILVNYCAPGLTLDCLAALARLTAQPGRILVVDNGSRDDSAQIFINALHNAHWPVTPEVLVLADNLGFAAGNNAAMHHLSEDAAIQAYWLLNTDTIPAPDALERLCERMNQPDRPGACGSVLLQPGEPPVMQCAGGGRINRLTATSHFILEGRPPAAAASSRDAVERTLDYLCAASMLVRRRVVEIVGPLDEDYFLYCEDAAWSLRMRAAGFKLGVAADSLVVHLEGGTTGAKSVGDGLPPPRPELVDYLSLRNRVRVTARLFPFFLPFVVASFAGVLLKRLQRGQANRFGLVMRALWDGLAGNMGLPPRWLEASRRR